MKFVAVDLVEVGVEVAQVGRELLPGEGDAEIPVGIALERDVVVEGVGGSEEPVADVGGGVPADVCGRTFGSLYFAVSAMYVPEAPNAQTRTDGRIALQPIVHRLLKGKQLSV